MGQKYTTEKNDRNDRTCVVSKVVYEHTINAQNQTN